MRVISGKYKGLEIKGYDITGTRPTMDRVKESLFASIQRNVKNSVCLDLFSGSGSLGIEALSMGASSCYFVDNNPIVIKTLKDNLKKLNIKEEYHLLSNDYKIILKDLSGKIKFDLIFLDPPYHLNFMNDSIKRIMDYDLLNDGGLLICEYEEGIIECNLTLIKSKKYGSKNISIYQK
ncbi:MAG: 16S rRNA (guanine(966)-N(2))-methyltransferase RsmD [Firmicutes bacterium]|nr:16S rRNA (guanine(966)-N(2))-methyltransferase RsmD [Bacillota bacterium]